VQIGPVQSQQPNQAAPEANSGSSTGNFSGGKTSTIGESDS